MRGGYVLLIKIPKKIDLPLKSIGNITLDSGVWAYVGSAMGTGSTNLENRIRRHFLKKKKIHWHIDYLLASEVRLILAIWAESLQPIECIIAQHLENEQGFVAGPRKFGASDCKEGCTTHLFCAENGIDAKEIIVSAFRRLNLSPKTTYDGEI